MRVDLKKFLFIGAAQEKEHFFKAAQEAAIIHFINMEGLAKKEVPAEISNVAAAIKILRGLPPTEQEETDEFGLSDGIASRILEMNHRLEKMQEEQRVLKLEIARVAMFGEFSKEEIAGIEKKASRKVQFFYAKHDLFHQDELPEGLIYIASEHNLDYFMAINKEARQYDNTVEMHIEEPVGILKQKLQTNNQETHSTEQYLKGYAKYNTFLHHSLTDKLNRYHLKVANDSVQAELNGDLFAADGWVPVDKIQEMNDLVKEMSVHVEQVAIEAEDRIPTHLENTGVSRIGEDLVYIYDTPSHTDKDPSLWVLLSFTLFFGMIIGDAGYGLLFLAGALFMRYKMGEFKGGGKRLWKLVIILSSACIIWGFFTHSFFGLNIGIDHPLRKASVIDWMVTKKVEYHMKHKDVTYQDWLKAYPGLKTATNADQILHEGVKKHNGVVRYELANKLADGILMEIALLIGIIHVMISFIRYLGRNWWGLGWIIFMIGCYLYFPGYLKTISMVNYIGGVSVSAASWGGEILLYLGFGLAFLLGIIQEKVYGLLQVMNLIQVFADILSYLRLYALGLAAAIVMATINEFAGSLNFVFGAILFVIGHLTNMALGIMGGVIHGLRLNFIEWYHYSFEGGGKKFDPLRKTSTD